MKIGGLIIVLLSLVLLSACGTSYVGDRMEEGKVVNTWQSAKDTVIQIQVVNGGFIEINEPYFGSLENPKVGDCVTIWVRVWKERLPFDISDIIHVNPVTDRNLAPCR